MSINAHYKSLEAIFYTLDKLIEQAHYHANINALQWLKKFRTDIVLDASCAGVHDASLPQQECNKQIIENFKECFRHALLFLQEHAQKQTLDHPSLFHELYNQKLITTRQRDSLLWTRNNIDNLCGACDEQGEHIVSTQLIESYRVIHEIVSNLSSQ